MKKKIIMMKIQIMRIMIQKYKMIGDKNYSTNFHKKQKDKKIRIIKMFILENQKYINIIIKWISKIV